MVNSRRHASTASENYIIGKRFFKCSSWFLDGSFWSLMVSSFWFDVVRKAFERHLLNSNPRLLTIELLVLLWSWSVCGFLIIASVLLLYLTSFDSQLDVILTLTNFRSTPAKTAWNGRAKNGNKPSQLCFFARKFAYWVVGPAGSGFVPPVDGSEPRCIIADLQEVSAKCFGSSAVCGKVYIVNRKRHASTASDEYI